MPPGDGARRRSAARSRRTPRDRHAARRAASWSGSRQPHSPRRWNRVAAQLSSRGIPPLRRRERSCKSAHQAFSRSPQRVGDLLALCLELLDVRLLGGELGLELLLRLAQRAGRDLGALLGLARLDRVPLGDELLLLGAGERGLELLAAELGLAALGAGLGLGGLARVLRRLDLVELGLDQPLGLARAVGLGALARCEIGRASCKKRG